jgi:hypothetical protein
MIHAQHIGPIGAQIHEAAKARRQRLFGVQEKKPVIIPPKPLAPRKPQRLEIARAYRGKKPHHDYDDDAIKQMRRDGMPVRAIALHFNINRKTMETYIRKHKARWESEG